MTESYLLSIILLAPFVGAAVLIFVSNRQALLVRQIAGLIARRIVTDHELGDTVGQGSRLGLIRFGSRVDTFLPDHAEPRVRVGDRTVGGVTVIGAWVR